MRYQSRYNQASPSEANNWGVPADLLAQVEAAKASKAKESKLIDALTKCADKVAVSA